MPKKIPDIIHNADIQRGGYVPPVISRTDADRAMVAKLLPESRRVYASVATGDRVWAYSYSNEAWFLSIVFEIRTNGQLGVYNKIYQTYGSGNPNGKFWSDAYTDKLPDGRPDLKYPLDIIKSVRPR